MKLYYSKGACSLAVRIVINEIGLPCNYEAVNLTNETTENGTDFLQINPKGCVPTLVLDDHTVLTENIAIQQYIADTHQAEQLLPPLQDFIRYRVIEWLSFVATDLHKTCGWLFNSAIPEEIKTQVIKPGLKKKLSFVNTHLHQNKYLTGEQFTVADAYLFVVLRWLPHLGLELNEWPNILKYSTELKQRKSIIQSLQEEQIE